MNPLRLAVIGAGHLGRIHARLASTIDQIELVAVVDPDPQARRQLADQLGVRPLEHHDQLASEIDAAVVATPTIHHHDVAMDLIERGVHLLVEKPLAATSVQAARLVRAARRAGLVLQVGHVERFNPALEAVQADVANPKYIEAVRTSGYTFRSTDIGAVLDIMIHDLDLVLAMVQSELVEVHALGISVFGGHEDMAQARLEFASGCVANLTASRCSFVTQRRMQIFAPQAYASLDLASGQATVVRPSPRLLQRQIRFETLSAEQQSDVRENLFRDLLPIQQLQVPPRNAILQELHDFADSIRSGRPPRVTGQQGLQAITVAEYILDEIATHRWTSVAAGPAGPLFTPSEAAQPPQPAGAEQPPRRKAG